MLMNSYSPFSDLLEGWCPHTTPQHHSASLPAGGFAAKRAGNDCLGNAASEQQQTTTVPVKEHLHRALSGERKQEAHGNREELGHARSS